MILEPTLPPERSKAQTWKRHISSIGRLRFTAGIEPEASAASLRARTAFAGSAQWHSYTESAMPIYEYRCERGHTFEVLQRMADDPVSVCTSCDASVERVLNPVAVHFKGSGFYTTDYGRAQRGAASDGDAGGAAKQADSTGGDAAGKDSSDGAKAGSANKDSSSTAGNARKSPDASKTGKSA